MMPMPPASAERFSTTAAAGAIAEPARRVSVLINNYNYAEFVGTAVKSVLDQTRPALEIIVVDDGSQDDSLSVLQGFGSAVSVVAKANGGQGSAYNAGFARCSGDIVIFLDADDWLYPDAVAQVVAAWRPGISKIQFPLTLVDRGGRSLERQVPRSMSDLDALELLQTFGTYNSPPGSGNAYDAGFLRKILPMNAAQWRIAADTVPISLAPAHGQLMSIAIPLGAYRLHRADDTSLLMNNAPADLWHDYDRIDETKKFVRTELSSLGMTLRLPLSLAPWEARVAILCICFGGAVPARFESSGPKMAWFALRSLWRWPKWSVKQKTLQAAWMLALLALPKALARRIALRHKGSVGRPAPPVAGAKRGVSGGADPAS